MALSEIGTVLGQYDCIELLMAQSETGFGMDQYDCRELSNSC
jgi:hypothetical protein